LIVTDLPTPEVPTMNITSPRPIARFTPRSTGRASNALVTPRYSISGVGSCAGGGAGGAGGSRPDAAVTGRRR
jgi:hypothetical protein